MAPRISRSLGAVAVAAVLAAGTGCVSPTPVGTFFELSPESHAQRAVQTRHFETSDEVALLSASAAALQDLGFQISESGRSLGFLRATKERSAREYGQEIARTVVATLSVAGFLSGSNTLIVLPVDLHQQINAVLVTRPVREGRDRHEVRVLFYRIVWKSGGQSGSQNIPPGEQRMAMIRDPKIYQKFIARLSKAVFLEAHTI